MSTFGSEIIAAVPEMRALAESRMDTTVEIGTYGPYEYDAVLERDVRVLLDSFTTAARIRVRSVQQQGDNEVGARTAVTVQRELHIPIDSPAVEPGMVARVVTLGPLSDPTLAGAEFTLLGVVAGDQMTARRLLVEEVQT